MLEIREIDGSYLKDYRHLSYRGYPNNRDFSKQGIGAFEEKIGRLLNSDKEYRTFAAFKDGQMTGVMFSIDFQMNIYGRMTKVSGLGTLAVDPFYKRKGIGRQLINYFEQDVKNNGVDTALLLPFRPDYYMEKGYGYLTKMNLYQIETQFFPEYNGQLEIRPISSREEISELHHEITAKTHGMIDLTFFEKMNLQEELDEYSNVFVGVYEQGKLSGYTSYKVQAEVKGNYTQNYLEAGDLIFNNSESLHALLGHFKAQQDQANYVQLHTPFRGFEQLFMNPLDQSKDFFGAGYLRANTQGVGLMAKILNPDSWMEKHGDQFQFSREVQWVVDGQSYGKGEAVQIKREHLAPLWFGAVSFNDLYRLGLVKCSSKLAAELSKVFTGEVYPVNYTDF